MRQALSILFLASLLAAAGQTVGARTPGIDPGRATTVAPPAGATDNRALMERTDKRGRITALSSPDTTWLLSSNFNGTTCAPQGWTSVDNTAQVGTYWHVDDYAGLSFGPVEGTKSLWCGTRTGSPVSCTYLALPGYGNSWDQMWCTKTCMTVGGGATSNLDVAFTLRYDSEVSYDGTSLEYTTDCTGNVGWIEIDGGNSAGQWNDVGTVVVDSSYSVGAGPVKVRLRFMSDSSWSDQDGFYNSNGAAHVDNLKVEDLALENFEDEAVGATSSNDWQSCNTPGYGDLAVLLKGSDLLQEDPCVTNLSCMWAFIKNSVANYACGGHPEQAVVPYINSRFQYISNEIWSPLIPVSGSGSTLNLQFDVYRDNLGANVSQIFYVWHVRTIVNGCPTAWKDRNFLYEGDDNSWFRHVENVGPLVNLSNATHVQFAIGVIDMCPFHCGWFGGPGCHSHAPLIDNVKAYRVNVSGPQWSVRDIDTFQDNFAADGTTTGKGRADSAIDIKPNASATFAPGDTAVILSLSDPAYAVGTGIDASGLSNDPNLSTFSGRHKTKKQVYLWAAVWPQGQPNKSGDGLSEGPGGQANRYPHIAAKDFVDGNGVTWTAIRADYTYTGTATNAGIGDGTDPIVAKRFNVDLNDNLFTPGDTILYFYGATSPSGTVYYSDQWHVTDNIAEVAANPMEFTILPAGGWNRGGDILYVDGADGLGVQPYYDGAFLNLGLADKVDRYDVRGPSSGVSNRLGGRVIDIAQQLNACYQLIIWDTGSLAITLGDGDGNPEKTDDYGLLNTFLSNLTNPGGIMLLGDKLPEYLKDYDGASAVAFRTNYMPFTLINSNHRVTPNISLSPNIVHWPGRYYSDDFFLFGGCPSLNDFDVLGATGSSLVEMSYTAATNPNGAVISNINGNAHVTMMGFSLAYVRDDETNGIADRAKFLRDSIVFTGGSVLPQVVPVGPALKNSLAQNYPNPFNPQTTIAFSIKTRGHVALSVYDVGGRLVRTLANETRAAGAYELRWDGRDASGTPVASGVYFYKLVAADFSQTKKMVLLK